MSAISAQIEAIAASPREVVLEQVSAYTRVEGFGRNAAPFVSFVCALVLSYELGAAMAGPLTTPDLIAMACSAIGFVLNIEALLKHLAGD